MSSNDLPSTFTSTKTPTRQYALVCRLAAGDSATVWLATRQDGDGPKQLVALKHARAAQVRSERSGLLEREALLASRVHHRNVVSILDGETLDDALVMVMEWVEGATLQALVGSQPLPARLVARIVQDACNGLGAIHGAENASGKHLGLVHRHVAPENVLVGTDGTSRLTDFGLAITNVSTRMTRKGIRKGKPAFMAPEYIQFGIATPATDLYALAAVAWLALRGTPLYPIEASINEVATLQRQPHPPIQGTRFESMLLRALGRGGERYADAAGFGAALAAACDGAIAEPAEVAAQVERVAADSLRTWRAAAV